MADEAQVRCSLQIIEGNLKYISQPTTYLADVAVGARGPTPGLISATLLGTDVDLSELTTPGLCRIQNLDSTNFVEVGIWDGVSFFPLIDILAGKFTVVTLAAALGEEFGTGTGTITADINTMRIKADTAACDVIVEAFDR